MVLSFAQVFLDICLQSEIQRVLSLDVSPDRIIYANTVKHVSHLRYAIGSGVRMMTFDCENELLKIKEHAPSARYACCV